jgi:hypothetical protein
MEIEQIRKGLYDDTFNGLADFLSYNELQKIKVAPLQYLIVLCGEVDKRTSYKPEDKKSIEPLRRRIRSISHMEGDK